MLLLVAVIFVIAQLLLLPVGRDLENDEAVYLSQFSRFAVAAPWEAHRAWGVPVLLLPVNTLTDSITAMRVYLAVVSGVALVLAFRPWLRVLPEWTAPLAALLFSTSWVVLFYGSEASPNLYVAFGGVAAVGYLCCVLWETADRRAVVGLVVSAAATALMRPTDSVWLLLPGFGAAVVATRARRVAGAGGLVAGLAIGGAPWLVEAFVRFGGPLARLQEANAAASTDGLHFTLPLHLRLLDGSRVCCFGEDRMPNVPLPGLTWWVALLALSVLGAVLMPRGRLRRSAVLALSSAVLIALSYVFLTGAVAARFLLPTYALLDVVAAAAVVALVRRAVAAPGKAGAAVVIPVVLAFTLYVHWHGAVTSGLGEAERSSRDIVVALSDAARERGLRPPCYAASLRGQAIALHLSCETSGIGRRKPLTDKAAADRHVAAGERVAIFHRGRLPSRSFLSSWRSVPLDEVRPRGWVMYVPPDASWVEAPGAGRR
jgi:hypothetical protein